VSEARVVRKFRLLYINLPLADEQKNYGALYLAKDVIIDPISYYTLRRVEHLRRSIVRKLTVFDGMGKIGDPAPESSPSPKAPEQSIVQETLAQ
jgi:hypothetical protein